VAVLHAGQGNIDAARDAYNRAADLYTGLDASWDLDRLDARMRAYNIRRGVRGPRRRPSTGWAALTPTEIRIAHLVAAGKSNPDIAAWLYLSRRTVETHVTHILTKLGSRSRLEVARHVTQVGERSVTRPD
jgi:DNA-binding NarL/FixJ family response regulator